MTSLENGGIPMAKRCCSSRNPAFIAQGTLVLILPWVSGPARGNPLQTDAASESSPHGAQESQAEWLKTDFGPMFDAQQWEFLGCGWTHDPQATPPALRLARKESDYSPPHRSPTHLALWRQSVEGSFEMTVDVISTHDDYGHRDVCFFLGWQDPAHFYYIHLAKQTDPHANQIFIVDGADRKAISLETSDGTPWDEAMHSVRIRRDIDTGEIAVWFDNSEKPVMRAVDKTFLSGRIGLGSFDDTADFYRLEVVAVDPEEPKESKRPRSFVRPSLWFEASSGIGQEEKDLPIHPQNPAVRAPLSAAIFLPSIALHNVPRPSRPIRRNERHLPAAGVLPQIRGCREADTRGVD